MPEILGDAPIYFSPFYQVDLFRALKRVMEEYPSRSEKSRLRYQIIKDKQLATLEMLVHSILNN
jgi:hypothetical protein